MPSGKLPPTPQKIDPGKLPLILLCEHFLISSFYLYANFRPKGKSFLTLFILYFCIILFSGMTYNVYHTYMHDQQCWASLPGYMLFLLATLFSTQPLSG